MFCELFSFIYKCSEPALRDQVPELSRLDTISLVLTILTILLGVVALLGYGAVRLQSQAIAREEAARHAKMQAEQFLKENGSLLVANHIENEQIVAKLQQQIRSLGLDKAYDAELVDDDPNWEPEQ